jgi:Fe-S-cluster containining protein
MPVFGCGSAAMGFMAVSCAGMEGARMASVVARYRDLLGTVDAWFGRLTRRFPSKIACRKGCTDCCLGPFDVTPLDAALLREGLAGLAEARREAIRARARDAMDRIAAVEPRLAGRNDLAGLAESEVDAVIDAVGPVPCPLLDPDGACSLYAHRPLVCRLNGIPVVDLRGRAIEPDGCPRNSLAIGDAPPPAIGLDVKAVRREEKRLLAKQGEGNAGRFIAQGLAE